MGASELAPPGVSWKDILEPRPITGDDVCSWARNRRDGVTME